MDMEDTKRQLQQLRDDVEAGHEHPGVSLLRLVDILLGSMPKSERQAPAPALVPEVPVE